MLAPIVRVGSSKIAAEVLRTSWLGKYGGITLSLFAKLVNSCEQPAQGCEVVTKVVRSPHMLAVHQQYHIKLNIVKTNNSNILSDAHTTK